MTLQFRCEPLAEPRLPPSLNRGAVPHSAVVFCPELAPSGALVRGVVVEVVDGAVVAEHLVYADEPGTYSEAMEYAATHRAAVVPGGKDRLGVLDMPTTGRLLRSRSFRSGWALLVGNVGPDLCSLGATAEFSGQGRVTIHPAGLVGPDATVWPTEPRLLLSALGGGVLARWGSSKRSTLPDGRREDRARRGPIGGALTLAAALAGAEPAGLDLRHACALFGVELPEPIDTHPFSALRAQAGAMAKLWVALVAELDRLRLPLNAGSVASPGSVMNVLMATTGIPPLANRFDLPDKIRGAGAAAFHGGWHDARVVGPPVPAVLADLGHAHLRSAIALGASRYLVAREVVPVDRTAVFRRFLSSPKLAELALDPGVRRRWGVTLVAVRPHGEPWPYQVDGKFRFAPLDLGGGLLWVHWPDAVASCLLSGRAAEVVEACYLRPVGRVADLRPVRLPSGRRLDLGRSGDLFSALVEERYAVADDESLDQVTKDRRVAFAKGLALMGYGLLARVDREPVGGKIPDEAITFDGRRVKHRNNYREVPGPYSWLPLAGAIAASTRLTVAVAMAEIAEEGGSWLHVAADSLVIAATHGTGPQEVCLPDGRKVRCLPLPAVEKALDRANGLYGGKTGWKREEGWEGPAAAVVSGTNRWGHIYENGRLAHLAEASLGGVLIDPTGQGREGAGNGRWAWAAELHGAYLRHIAAGGQPGTVPDDLPLWSGLPAVFPNRAGTKAELERLRAVFGPAVRPFAAYSTVHTSGGLPAGLALGHAEPSCWARADWRDGQGQPVELFAHPPSVAEIVGGSRGVLFQSVGAYFFHWAREARRPGVREPVSLVANIADAVPVGKINDWLIFRPGLVADDRGRLLSRFLARSAYRRGAAALTEDLRAALVGVSASHLSDLAGLAPRTARALLAGRAPSKATLEKLLPVLENIVAGPSPACLGCGRELSGRQRLWCRPCRSSLDGPTRARLGTRCPSCGTVRVGDTSGPCSVCADRPAVEVAGVTCPGCGVERFGDVSGPCPFCERVGRPPKGTA